MGKISILMNKIFCSKPVFCNSDSDKCMKTKLKLYGNKMNTNFQGKKYQKEIHHTNNCHW